MRFIKAHRVATTVVVAVLALAVGGIAYATIPGGGGLISGCYDLKTGALRVYDASGGPIASCSAKESSLTWNQTGPQGPPGAQGPAGTAKAWARIDLAGGIVASHGLGSATVSHPATGIYCIKGLPFQPYMAVATAPAGIQSDGAGGFVPTGYDVNVTASTLDTAANPDTILAFCDTPGAGASQVRVYVANSNGLFDRGFSIVLDG